MGSIRKRGEKYRAEVRRGSFYRSREFVSKTAARAWIVETEADWLGGERAGASRKTLRDALTLYAERKSSTKRGERWERIRLSKLAKDFGEKADLRLSAITAMDIEDWKQRRLRSVKESSVGREWNLLRSVFRTAIREWKWIRDNPMSDIARPRPGVPRKRRVRPGELEALYRAAQYQDGTYPSNHGQRVVLAFELAIETGMRAGEIRSLDSSRIDLSAGVATLLTTKNGDPREVPLSARARELVRLLASADPLLPMSAKVMDATFRKVRAKAGIKGLTFHDSRAEACTRFATVKKIDVLTLARIIGHRDLKSLNVYYREETASIAARLG